MTTYVVGDIQGCLTEFTELLSKISFDPSKDVLWLTGDLVNRGPDNAETLRFIRDLGSSVISVQGNHDLHLIAIVFGDHMIQPTDTFHDILSADDCEQLCHWLCKFPLLHIEAGYVLVHAGIPHIWTLSQAWDYAQEVHNAMLGTSSKDFFCRMYGNEPARWSYSLRGVDRLRAITNYLTRMRCVDPVGRLNFEHVLGTEHCPENFRPWFEYSPQYSEHVAFGHWASIGGVTNRFQFHAVDTGCVWGRQLTALRLPDHKRFSVSAKSIE